MPWKLSSQTDPILLGGLIGVFYSAFLFLINTYGCGDDGICLATYELFHLHLIIPLLPFEGFVEPLFDGPLGKLIVLMPLNGVLGGFIGWFFWHKKSRHSR